MTTYLIERSAVHVLLDYKEIDVNNFADVQCLILFNPRPALAQLVNLMKTEQYRINEMVDTFAAQRKQKEAEEMGRIAAKEAKKKHQSKQQQRSNDAPPEVSEADPPLTPTKTAKGKTTTVAAAAPVPPHLCRISDSSPLAYHIHLVQLLALCTEGQCPSFYKLYVSFFVRLEICRINAD